VAIVAEVEIDRRSGKIWAKKFTVAHDCGLIINPDGLRRCIEGNVVQDTSRALSEEVTFDRARETMWTGRATKFSPLPKRSVLLNRPELLPSGAGESSIRRCRRGWSRHRNRRSSRMPTGATAAPPSQ
jgi:hypothetical protein